jgi:signal transduction histidine kinase
MKRGDVGLKGATGAVLDRSLIGLRDLIDRSLTEVRLGSGLAAQRKAVTMRELLDDIQVASALEAKSHGVAFVISPVADGLVVNADRQMLDSAIANLLQNAFKFTHAGGVVTLTAHGAADRIFIDVQDECGGLPPGKAEELFKPFEQRSEDRSGVGLGLSISRRAVEANEGVLRVRNLYKTGCVFTIELPRV